MTILDLNDFGVALHSLTGDISLVQDVAFQLRRGETLCIVGESGSGKTVTALSILRLLEFTSAVQVHGTAQFDGVNLVAVDQDEMSDIRGHRASMIFQEAMEALNPTIRIGDQLVEAALEVSAKDAWNLAVSLLGQVGISDPEGCMRQYPHQLSGGMQQRTMIAMALMCDPELLIADEPTTALDVTTQAEILLLLRRIQQERNMACILITHDMGVAAEIADRIAVMYAGRLVEIGATERILRAPEHPYTKALLDCIPRPGDASKRDLNTIPGSVPSPAVILPGCRFADRCSFATDICHSVEPKLLPITPGEIFDSHRVACYHPLGTKEAESASGMADNSGQPRRRINTEEPFVQLENVTKVFAKSARGESLTRQKRGSKKKLPDGVRAVNDISLTLNKGEFFGLVGESGSGKTTLGRMICRLEPLSDGTITIDGLDIGELRGRRSEKAFRRLVQIVFQDPNGSLDPRYTVGQAVAEPLQSLDNLRADELRARIAEILSDVGLPAEYTTKFPSELSGGQRQRVAIARAIATNPSLIIADEPTSALDVSVQGQIINLLRKLQRDRDLTYLFITHNLSLVLTVADRIGVMYLGRVVEVGEARDLLNDPAHPYTQILFEASPDPENPRALSEAAALESVSSVDAVAVDLSIGCAFRERCPRRQDICDTITPKLERLADGREAACHFPLPLSIGSRLSPPEDIPITRSRKPNKNGGVL